jgi:DNA-binding transcriptional ArsR family regulator
MGEQSRDHIDELRQRVDALTTQMETLSRAVEALQPATPAARRPRPELAGLWKATDAIAQRARAREVRGLSSVEGCYIAADEREYRWRRELTADALLAQDDDMVARVLAALGSKQRLLLLKAVLEQPGNAADLIERAGLTSAGQAYHHLNTLAAAGLLRSGDRGQFEFVGHQAPAFLTLLTGVWQMLSTMYGTGDWTEDDPVVDT